MPIAATNSVESFLSLLDKKGKHNTLFHVFNFIDKEYGGSTSNFLRELGLAASLGLYFKNVKNKKIRFLFNLFKFGIPTVLIGTELYQHYKHYVKAYIKKENSVYDRKVDKIAAIYRKFSKEDGVDDCKFDLGDEIITWFSKSPKLNPTLKVLAYYDVESMKEIESIKKANEQSILMLIQYKNFVFAWNLNIMSTTLGLIYSDATLYYPYATRRGNEDINNELRKEIISSYINYLDKENTYIIFEGWGGIKTLPRPTVTENIIQLNVPDLIQDIDVVLKAGRKRALVLAGEQGTGKSTIIRKVIEEMKRYVVIHLRPSDLDSTGKIQDRFQLIRTIQPLILIIEDFDSCNIKTKNERTGLILDMIDDVNNNLNIFIIVTVNDTSQVHFSIINRPGRFDVFKHIKPPQSCREYYEVMLSKFSRLKEKYCPDSNFKLPLYESIDLQLLEILMKHKFTQADVVSGILEKIFIEINKNKDNWDPIDFNKYLKAAILLHIETKRAIQECKFNDKDPIIMENEAVSDGSSSYGFSSKN